MAISDAALASALNAARRAIGDDGVIGDVDRSTLNLQKKIGFQHVISGSDLKTLRTASGITVEHLFKKTRVGVSTLKNIEEDRFDDLPPHLLD